MFAQTISLYRNAYSGLSKSTWLLSIVMLVNRSGTMVLPFMTIYLTSPSMGYSIGKAGLVMGIFGLGAICGGFLGGRLTDRLGFRQVQLIALVGGGFLFILLGQMKSFPLICGATFLLSLVNESFRPANSTAIASYSKEENRTRSFSLNRLAINLGWAVGGAMGGILASINYHLLFWVDGCTNLAGALLLFYLLAPAAEKKLAEKAPDHKTETITAITATSPYRDPTYLRFILFTIFFAACFFQLFTILPVYYKTVLHLQEYTIGLIMTLNGIIITLFEMVLVFKLEGRRPNLVYISFGVCLVSLSFMCLNLLPAMLGTAIVCMILITVGEIGSMPFMNSFWISRTTHSNRGQYAGLYTIAWSVAQVIGPAGGAQIAEHAGYTILWWTIAALCLLAAAGFRSLQNKINS